MTTLDSGRRQVDFKVAQPIWPEDRQNEKNLFVGFRATFAKPAGGRAVLRITGASIFRIYHNGVFVGHGPARAAHGYARVDEIDLTDSLCPGDNIVAIEVAGYNVNSYYLAKHSSFLQAEIIAGGEVVAATGAPESAFAAKILTERIQKVPRYSFQRPFSECYEMAEGYDRWRSDPDVNCDAVPCALQEGPELLERGVPYPRFNQRGVAWQVSTGTFETDRPAASLRKDRSLTHIGPTLEGYTEDELTIVPTVQLQNTQSVSVTPVDKPFVAGETLPLESKTFRLLDLGTNLTGFVGVELTCSEETHLYLTFDEILCDGDVDFTRLGAANILSYQLAPGHYSLESFEPYTLHYLKILLVTGHCEVKQIYLRELANPAVDEAPFSCPDRAANRIFEAARETCRQNATDIMMDCPSRERAGWLCDSFFTARAVWDLCGNADVERNFLENFLLPDTFEHLPPGMLPMCYPGDHPDGVFIPNWAMWFVLELPEYIARSGDQKLVDALKPRVYALLDYFKPFLNSDGLLEKLTGWVFIEWSKANEFVQDVNYPSNMLYAAMLNTAGLLYNDDQLIKQAQHVRQTIITQAFDGEFFVDNAVRQDGALQVTDNRTEVCQYYAFFFDVATPQTHPELWSILCEQFGPQRPETGAYPDVHPANAFIGNYLRLELLSRYGRSKQALAESHDFFLPMVERTGTLWEHNEPSASCNHGFASHVLHLLYRDVLGIHDINLPEQTITLRFSDVDLDWAQGCIPLDRGPVKLSWWLEDEALHYKVAHPAGFELRVVNPTQRPLVRHP